MLQQWKQLLENSGAEFENGILSSFGNPDRERRIPPQGDIICDLSHIGIIRVQGEDATDFLQNQLTNDISQVSESQAQLSAWCNPKGRTIATFLVHKKDNNYYLSLTADLMDFVLKRLKMFVMRSKVVLEDVTQLAVHFGFTGSHILQDWDACCDGELPNKDYDAITSNNLSIIKLPGIEPRYEVIGDFEKASKLWEKLNVRAAPVSGEAWNYLNIACGLPVISEASREAWVAQMLNLQIINAISFKKGCFPGQEVVARLKYLGKTKRRLYRIEFVTDVTPSIGESIFAKEEDTEAGKIVNAVLNPDGKIEVLAVLKIAMAGSALHLMDVNGSKGKVLELPYPVED